MSDPTAAKAAEAGVPYYPPPPSTAVEDKPTGPPVQVSSSGPPPLQTTPAANAAPIPAYVPAEAAKVHPLQSNPPPPDTKTSPAAASPVTPSAVHPNEQGISDSHVPPVSPIASSDADAPSKRHSSGSSFAKWGKKLHQLGTQAALPINSLANKMGVQSFLPTTMDKECEKAADILVSFTKSGVVVDKPVTGPDGKPTKEKSKALIKIPHKVISNCVGVVVFTAVRAGFQVAGTTGSGVLVARLPDGSWSPPSGIQVASLGGGFLIGLEVYDCVLVINNPAALAAFLRTRVSLGPEVAVAAGPFGAGGGAQVGHGAGPRGESGSEDVVAGQPGPASPTGLKPGETKHKRRSSGSGALSPVFSYVKSKGFYAGVQVDGTVIVERKEANAAFYGAQIGVDKIIKGQTETGQRLQWPPSALKLLDVLNKSDASHAATTTTREPGSPTQVGSFNQTASMSQPGPFRQADGAEDLPPVYVDTGKPYPKDEKVQYS
ncbi:hypothetical protein TD95_001643 [Thielaviopsis punctulata]|uniref:Ysc84 actin-binding domain-containing protein n=1 Tax=Thielaviopsis punctulata TaxID=72032 RepID=A0A0F4Z832_9PEZI|nr:hypothetical protein TD95_001643 [Thielaviopsis punctulata]